MPKYAPWDEPESYSLLEEQWRAAMRARELEFAFWRNPFQMLGRDEDFPPKVVIDWVAFEEWYYKSCPKGRFVFNPKEPFEYQYHSRDRVGIWQSGYGGGAVPMEFVQLLNE